MDEKDILQRQVDALEKLLQIKEAIIQEQEAKITKLEQEVLLSKFPNFPQYPQIPLPPTPFIGGGLINFDPCPNNPANGNHHDYPTVWHGTTPPPCNKCGKLAPNPAWTVTSSNSISMLDDEERALGTITDIANKKGRIITS